MPQYRIIHFSDLHAALCSFRHGGLFDKRLLGRLNFLLRRRHAFRAERILEAAKVFASLHADLFVCTGDLTSVGDIEEFALGERLLEPLLELANGRFVYIPGNHDAYIQNKDCRKALEDTFYRLNGKSFQLHDLPLRQVVGPAELILCNAARPSPIYSSNGAFSNTDWERLEKLLHAPKSTPFRLLLEHFPTLDAAARLLSWRRRLKQAPALLKLQDDHFDALLCGHIHQPFVLDPPHPRIICAGSLTLHGSFAIIDLDPETNSIECTIKTLSQIHPQP
jgi:predicted phosphodiesterase